jgi:beta-fructofuranosidase
VKKKSTISATRREFLAASAALASIAALPSGVFARSLAQEAGGIESVLAADPLRPQFHLLPARNWMNDPNGPIYHNGRYHMFFQYNPNAAVWGDMSWDHAISPDMIHWTHLPVAMTPTSGGPDSFGCFSGSCLAVGTRVYAVYTGVVPSTPEHATIRDGSNKLEESQCLSWSDDPELLRWTKLPQPIIPDPPPGLEITGFRDPSAWKQGNTYYMTVGSGVAKQGGCVLLYRSMNGADLKHWTYLHTLTSAAWSGKPAANPVDSGEMWECPEFFALDGGHVLIYSTEGKVFWRSGKLNTEAMLFEPAKMGQLDLGSYYAPKTQLDAQGRRILWGWIPETRPEAQYSKAGWAGMMSLPRVLHLDPDGTLRMEILPALAELRSTQIAPEHSAQMTTFTLPRANGELICIGVPGSAFDLVITNAATQQELMRVGYLPEKHALSLADSEVALAPDEAPHVHAFIDGSVIGLIAGKRVGDTKRFYYPQPSAPPIKVSINGAGIEASAWSLKPISDNRLTTPARQA